MADAMPTVLTTTSTEMLNWRLIVSLFYILISLISITLCSHIYTFTISEKCPEGCNSHEETQSFEWLFFKFYAGDVQTQGISAYYQHHPV